MIYNACFSDAYFTRGEFKVELKPPSTMEEFIQLLLTMAVSMAREKIVATGFDGLVHQFDQREWGIHDVDPSWIYKPPEIIWICSNCDCNNGPSRFSERLLNTVNSL